MRRNPMLPMRGAAVRMVSALLVLVGVPWSDTPVLAQRRPSAPPQPAPARATPRPPATGAAAAQPTGLAGAPASAPTGGMDAKQPAKTDEAKTDETKAAASIPPALLKMTVAEQLALCARHLHDIKLALARTYELVNAARKERDAVRLNCLNQYLRMMKERKDHAERRHVVLQASRTISQRRLVADSRDATYRVQQIVAVQGERKTVLHLAWEAEACAGGDVQVTGPALPADVLDEDSGQPPRIREPLPARPPLASPAQP